MSRNMGAIVSVINGSGYTHIEINRRIRSDAELTGGIAEFLAQIPDEFRDCP